MGMADIQIALRAWSMGLNWKMGSPYSENEKTACSSAYPESADSMPPQAVQQSTKRDPLTRFQSQE